MRVVSLALRRIVGHEKRCSGYGNVGYGLDSRQRNSLAVPKVLKRSWPAILSGVSGESV